MRRPTTLIVTLLSAIAPMSTFAQNLSIFAVPMPPNWPVTMAALIPSSLRLPASAQFEWSFPTAQNPSCTTDGRTDVSPCRGRVVDHYFPEGTHAIHLTVTDASLAQPIRVSIEVEIRSIQQFPVAQRPEIRSVPLDVWTNKYVPAYYALKESGVYDHLSKIHRATFSVGMVANSGTQRSTAHSSPAFLPWHRMSMRVFERCLQVAANDDELGLPYYDWMMPWDQTVERYIGGTGDSSKSFIVQTGPFAESRWRLPDDFPDPIKSIRRNLGSDSSFRWQTKAEFDRLMTIPNYDLPPFNERPTPGSFRNAVEGWLASQDSTYGFNHNGLHRWMGGTMAEVTVSFQDPVFHLHHAQVDRMYTLWQKQRQCADGRGSATCYRPGETDPDVNAELAGAQQNVGPNGRNRYALVGSMFTDNLFPWNVKISDVLRAEQGYVYLNPGQAASAATGKKAPTTKGNGTFFGGRPSRSSADGAASVSVFQLISIAASSMLFI